MKKNIFNAIFYLICFFALSQSIYRVAFTVPPVPGTPGYQEYFYGTIVMSIVIGLMVIIPNLVIEYLVVTGAGQTHTKICKKVKTCYNSHKQGEIIA